MLIAVHIGGPECDWQTDDALDELAQLLITAGGLPVGRIAQRLRSPHPLTYLQSGKLTELCTRCQELDASLIVADDELTPNQQRSLEAATGLQVLDRTAIILDIFAQHARSRDGSLQVELAQLRYTLPRLVSTEKALSRLGAGIGTRGPGESKLETDRRRVKDRIVQLLQQTERLGAQRRTHRRWRARQAVETVAIVGYTNAGKSTLLNRLTGANALAADQPFATLDPTTRQLVLPGNARVLLTDTVGFIRKLPSDLLIAFKATLEEVTEADLLLHVVDASHPRWLDQALVCYQELESLGALDRPIVTALNKADRAAEPLSPEDLAAFPNAVRISATTGAGLPELLATMAAALADAYVDLTVHIPFRQGDLVHLFRERGRIDHESHDAAGTILSGRLPRPLAGLYTGYHVARSAS